MIHKLILYGSGKRCMKLCKLLQQTDIEMMIIVVDSNPAKWGDKVEGYGIDSPDRIGEFPDANLCITIADIDAVKEIREELHQKYQYGLDREVSYNKLIVQAYKENTRIKQTILGWTLNNSQKKQLLFESICGLGLGGVEMWTMDICSALITGGEEYIYIISDNGIYDVPALLENHIIYVDIDYEKNIDTMLSLIKIILHRLPCKIVISMTNIVMLAACVIKCYFPELIEIIPVIHVGLEKHYNDYMDFKESVDFYIGVSHDIRNGMIRKGIEQERVYSMTCPFDCEQTLIRTYNEDYSLPIRIGYAGRMGYSQKRMDLLMKLAKVLEQKKICFRMELAGDGLARKEMEEFVHLNKLDERVYFLGRLERSKLPFFWKRQDICVNLADYEGRSISIIEAMGNGAVPVVTATSGVREDIVDNVNGYIVPLGDYLAMAEKIEYLAEHRERLHGMGKLAHDVVYPKSLMETHLKFWREILQY